MPYQDAQAANFVENTLADHAAELPLWVVD
jgi:hypothetical protein